MFCFVHFPHLVSHIHTGGLPLMGWWDIAKRIKKKDQAGSFCFIAPIASRNTVSFVAAIASKTNLIPGRSPPRHSRLRRNRSYVRKSLWKPHLLPTALLVHLLTSLSLITDRRHLLALCENYSYGCLPKLLGHAASADGRSGPQTMPRDAPLVGSSKAKP